MILLDTNICIYIIREKPPEVISRLKTYDLSEVKISSIVAAEMYYGVEKSLRKSENLQALMKFLAPFEIIDFNLEDARAFGTIRSNLEKLGRVIGSYDMQIAAQALSRSWTLITNNEREFSRIDGLRFENWVS